MSLWRTMCREAAGAVRSIRYDLGLLKSRRGRPTRRLVIAVGVLTVLAASGVGTAIAVVDALGEPPAERAAVASGGTDSGLPGDSGGVSLSGADQATGSTRISPSPDTPGEPERTGTASPTPTPGPSRTGPTRTRPPAPTPTSPSPSASPSPSPSTSDSPTTSSSASPSPS